jgi:hypothetical protein
VWCSVKLLLSESAIMSQGSGTSNTHSQIDCITRLIATPLHDGIARYLGIGEYHRPIDCFPAFWSDCLSVFFSCIFASSISQWDAWPINDT